MSRDPIPTYTFALVVVRREERFLVLRERKHGQKWYLPAGRIEPGETIAAGAYREVLEETGVPVTLTGILRIQHTPHFRTARLRVLFVARPQDDTPPRTTPNEHSLEARWVTLAELETLPLRGPEVRAIFAWVADGAPIYPLDLLGDENATP